MSNQDGNRDRDPTAVWLSFLLKMLVFLVFACVIVGAMVGVMRRELITNRMWLIIAGMAAMLLLLAIDRLVSLEVGPGGMKAQLAQAQVKALDEVAAMEDQEVAQAAQAKILQARTPAEVEGAVGMALELNVSRVVERVKAAIHDKRKLYVRYRVEPAGDVEVWLVAPLDVKPGKTARTQAKDYLWVHSYESGRSQSLLLERVAGVDVSDEAFDPAEIMAGWRNPTPQWNVEREW